MGPAIAMRNVTLALVLVLAFAIAAPLVAPIDVAEATSVRDIRRLCTIMYSPLLCGGGGGGLLELLA
jgi:hypothetical protein